MKSFAALTFMMSVATAHAGIKGQCIYEGNTLSFIDAHAALAPDPFDGKLKVPMLWATTKPLDHSLLMQAKFNDVEDAISDQIFELHSAKLELRFDAEGKLVEGLQLYVPPGNNRSVSGNDVGELTLNAPMSLRANGRFLINDDELNCDVQFDLPIAGKGPPPPPPKPKPWGAALPAGGGEPGKTYLTLHKATLAGDVDTLLNLVTKDKADKMREARKDPEFPKMLEMIRMFEPAQVRILSGRTDGNRAELQIDGKQSDGAAMTGVVKLLRESGSWRVENVSTKSKIAQ